ncbi:RDD family protein [Actinocorallia aurantiaca]|uniref:RDD domain-containing protein n=1 Tax=Actinocorallia aurantiaca TaxID=46204 RepID=A0ABN3TZL9_9ACTN
MTIPPGWQGEPSWQNPQSPPPPGSHGQYGQPGQYGGYLPQGYHPTYDPDGPHDRYYYAEPPWGPPDAPPGCFAVAHLGKRLLARVVDVLIVIATAVALIVPIVVAARDRDPEMETSVGSSAVAVAFLIVFGGYFLYDGVQNALWSRTLGKRLMRLRVASADAPHLPLSKGIAFGRAALYPMGFTLLGMLPMIGLISTLNSFSPLWDRPRRQAWHDKMAKTVVLNDRRP